MKFQGTSMDTTTYTFMDTRGVKERDRLSVTMKPLDIDKSCRISDGMVKMGKKGIKAIETKRAQVAAVVAQLKTVTGDVTIIGKDGKEKTYYGDPESEGLTTYGFADNEDRYKFLHLIPRDYLEELIAVFGKGAYSASAEDELASAREIERLRASGELPEDEDEDDDILQGAGVSLDFD